MFETGKPIFRNGFMGVGGDVVARKRLRIIYYFFVFLFAIFALRTLQLGIQGTKRARTSVGNSEWLVQRADIVDRNGDILAKNVASGHIDLIPKFVKDPDAVADLLHRAMPHEYSLADALKLVSAGKYKRIRHVPESARKLIASEKVSGLDVVIEQKRMYPKRRLFSHAVGFVNQEGHGQSGAEGAFDDYLRENTDPLQLSLDARIQSVFYEQLSIAMQKYQAKAAMGMLMNSRTGEIIAMVSLPDYDPENISLDPVSNRMFMPMRGVFEMGSIFKIFNTAMAMENGITKEYYVKEPFYVKNKFGRRVEPPIRDIRSFKPPRPNLTVEEIMLHSCNVGSAQIALDLPDGTQPEFFHRIHFDEALNLELGRTEKTLLPRQWGPMERATVSFGHGIAVTPMHLLLAVNAMTNGGFYVYPTLQKRGVGAIQGTRVISDEISARLRKIMFRIAEETTAKKARVAGIEIGGKTGTAEKRDAHGKIDTKRNLTAFAGIFPVSAPQYTILIVLDEPKSTPDSFGWRTAAWNAVPTAGKILDSILPLLFE